jgi:hypothetical protein
MTQPEPIKVQKFLSGMSYPATKHELVEHAKDHRANRDALQALESIPDRRYEGPNEVSQAVAKS